jgi:CelD/BcsL family acetyltransferase involved in cellulose biosynthesis
MLEINFLNVGDQRAAAMWNFVYRDRMMLYNSGLNPLDYSGVSAGIVLLTFSIEDAARRGYRLFDFLQGDEEYKYRMGASPTAVHRLTIWR